MKDISYHILDIVQNSLHAGAEQIIVDVAEETKNGTLGLKIKDNGLGMTSDELKVATDPFYTTSVTKKVGLGLPLLKQNAELTGGTFHIKSVKNHGTVVFAEFISTNIDMIPMGDMALTFKTLIAMNPEKDITYRHKRDGQEFILDTAEIRRELGDIPLNTHEVLDYITNLIQGSLKALSK